jgi:hypothetical protein
MRICERFLFLYSEMTSDALSKSPKSHQRLIGQRLAATGRKSFDFQKSKIPEHRAILDHRSKKAIPKLRLAFSSQARVLKREVVCIISRKLICIWVNPLVHSRIKLGQWPAATAEKEAAGVTERMQQIEHRPDVAARTVTRFAFDHDCRMTLFERPAPAFEHG